MAGASGQFGKVNIGSSLAVECTNWTFDREAVLHGYASCSTSGYRRRVAGTKQGAGTISGVLDPADPIDDYIDEGDSVTLELFETAARKWIIPALIGRIRLEVDIEEGDVIRWVSDFESNGAWTKP